MRMQRARELLDTTDDKLEAIAPRVGYRSPIAFSRAFARTVGVMPSDYRGRRAKSGAA
jgi:transcriptional regulator GlxA family with amidase domain